MMIILQIFLLPFYGVLALNPCNLCQCSEFIVHYVEIYINCAEIKVTTEQLSNFELPNNTGILDLSKNEILLSNQWLIYDQLKSLSLSYNSVIELESNVFNYMKSLRRLDLSHNKLTILKNSSLKGLDSLEHLDLSHNLFQEIPLLVLRSSTPNLSVLMIGSNPLDKANILTWNGPEKIKQIDLDYSNVSSHIIWPNSEIQELNLRGNCYSLIPHLPKSLTFLDLSRNNISQIQKEAFIWSPNLETLILEDMPFLNKIEKDALNGLSKLKKLSLDGNGYLTYFPAQVFDPSAKLLDVSLENCNLTTLDEALSSITFANLDLMGNPWNCDCSLTWLNSQPFETPVICQSPEYLKGQQLPGSATLCLKGWIRAHSTVLVATIAAMLSLMITAILLVTWEFVKYRPGMRRFRQRVENTCPCLRSLNSDDEEELYTFDEYEPAFEPLHFT